MLFVCCFNRCGCGCIRNIVINWTMVRMYRLLKWNTFYSVFIWHVFNAKYEVNTPTYVWVYISHTKFSIVDTVFFFFFMKFQLGQNCTHFSFCRLNDVTWCLHEVNNKILVQKFCTVHRLVGETESVCAFVYRMGQRVEEKMLMYLWCSEVCYGVQRHVKAMEGDSDDENCFSGIKTARGSVKWK